MDVLNKKLQVQHLSMTFEAKTVLDNICFDVFKGEFLTILGPSGCGKTTILRLIMGLLNPSVGTIIKDGRNITALLPFERGMGMVFQNYALFENMTVKENIAYALKTNKKFKKRAPEIVLDMLELVGLEEHANKKPCHLSGGQQQRTAIARTLALKPDIILFDEPMAALDVASRNSLRNKIKEIQNKFETTIIYVTHDQEEAFSMSDRIMIMGKNTVHQIDTPQNIIQHPSTPFVENFVIDNLKLKINSLSKFIGDSVKESRGQPINGALEQAVTNGNF